MAKLIAGLFAYVIAFAAFYAATDIAPDMAWPRTSLEFMAAQFLVIGAVAKTIGCALILRSANG